MATSIPSCPSWRVTLAPIPREAPVTRAVLPRSGRGEDCTCFEPEKADVRSFIPRFYRLVANIGQVGSFAKGNDKWVPSKSGCRRSLSLPLQLARVEVKRHPQLCHPDRSEA